MTTTAPAVPTATGTGRGYRVGLALAGLLGVVDLAALFVPLDPNQPGPPMPVLVFGTVMGVVTLTAVVAGWRTGSRVWSRVAAGTRILSALTAVPAFFVPDVPAPLVLSAAGGIALTVVAVYLLLRRPSPQP